MDIFSSRGFPARWDCGSGWSESPWIGWLHVVADVFTFLAYYAVPLVTMYFVVQRPRLKFPPIFYVFLAAIFLTCGTGHLLEAIIFWWPIYRFAGLVKLITAVVSCAGVIALARILPTALALKSGSEYERVWTEKQKVQESLEHERFLLHTLLEHLPDAIYFKDTEGRFTRVSLSLARRLGCSSSDNVVGKSDADFFSPEFAAVTRADEVQLMQSGQTLAGKPEQIHWPGNTSAWVSTTKVPLRDESGRIAGIVGISHDVSEFKAQADALRASEERYALAVRGSTDGIWDWDILSDRVYYSERLLELVGYASHEVSNNLSSFRSWIHPEDHDRTFAAVEAHLKQRVPYDVEYRLRTKAGAYRWFRARGQALWDEQGQATRMAGSLTDITERHGAEKRFRQAVEASPSGMLIVNRDGRILLVNSQAEALFGYSRDELLSTGVDQLLPERYRNSHPRHREDFLADPQARPMGRGGDLKALRKDGTEVDVEIGLSPLQTDEGLTVLCSVSDITERKQAVHALQVAKDEAESASRAKSSFLANMSHEIRTPMNGIIGMTQLLAQTELRSYQRDYLATVNESAHILLRLLNDILDFSKIEAGKLELDRADFRISECVARATQMLVLRAAEKGLEIACRVAPEIPDYLRGDAGRLQQVLVNLVSNAVKFTNAGEIFVNVNAESITEDNVRLHISVSDTGIGIPVDKLEQVFHPFEQAESSTTRRFGGTGLGLAISRQLVEMMHGRIWIDSEFGRGSTFHFTAEFGLAADQQRPAQAELDSLRDLPVLVVDDNITNRRILSEMLLHWRMKPMLADSAAAARQVLQQAEAAQQPIRLILLDHHMPGEDGIHFAESLRDRLKPGQCPIILISSGSSAIDEDLGQKCGIGRFMTKPVIASELLDEVLRQFGRYTTAKPAELPKATAQAVDPRRVLLVEDNEVNRRVAIGLLRSRGHQVVVAENGQEAVNTLSTQEFDVVLMDMQMPLMDGYEATAAIRQREHQTGGHIPIVAMTAEALKGDRERCLAVGMDDYVSKPIDPVEMYRAVERFPALCLAADAGLLKGLASVEPLATKQNGSTGASPARDLLPPAEGGQRAAVDWNMAKKALGSSQEALSEFSRLVHAQAPTLLADLRRAIETRDAKLLRLSAHTLKSSVSYFGAEPLVEAALALEVLGRAESFDTATTLLDKLEQELTRVLAALEIGPANPQN